MSGRLSIRPWDRCRAGFWEIQILVLLGRDRKKVASSCSIYARVESLSIRRIMERNPLGGQMALDRQAVRLWLYADRPINARFRADLRRSTSWPRGQSSPAKMAAFAFAAFRFETFASNCCSTLRSQPLARCLGSSVQVAFRILSIAV
jgi:hypothetical protein